MPTVIMVALLLLVLSFVLALAKVDWWIVGMTFLLFIFQWVVGLVAFRMLGKEDVILALLYRLGIGQTAFRARRGESRKPLCYADKLGPRESGGGIKSENQRRKP